MIYSHANALAYGVDDSTLTCIEAEQHIPFALKRVFYLYDVPVGQTRGAHVHKELHQVLICLGRSFDVLVGDGRKERRFSLASAGDRPVHSAVDLGYGIDFQPGTVCMALASDESDYYRDYGVYLEAVAAAQQG